MPPFISLLPFHFFFFFYIHIILDFTISVVRHVVMLDYFF